MNFCRYLAYSKPCQSADLTAINARAYKFWRPVSVPLSIQHYPTIPFTMARSLSYVETGRVFHKRGSPLHAISQLRHSNFVWTETTMET